MEKEKLILNALKKVLDNQKEIKKQQEEVIDAVNLLVEIELKRQGVKPNG